MANPISDQLKTGTIGEILVQLRLLQYDVQAAPPLKDSGNDLIALKSESFKTIQVKTTTTGTFSIPNKQKVYHILAIVSLQGEGNNIWLDSSDIFLIPKGDVAKIGKNITSLDRYRLNENTITELFR